ncbi:MAG: ABC transporter ATP-binding protein [Planctomycetia bacterium]|nr:ABC transporter ATP-binding protein [Planctomycetia bacterium]
MIEVFDLVKEYRSGDGATVRAVDGISFVVHPGEMVGLLGGNGAGKTTTMRILATLLKPTAGTASIAGHDVRTEPLAVRRRLGYLSTTTGVPDRLTPREVLESYGQLHGLRRGLLADRIDSLSATLDLGGFSDRPCGRLSSGQRQRVSLARALVHDPPVLVLDEPTSALDVLGSRDLLALLDRLRSDGRTILLSTHRLHEIERRCDRFLVISGGRILAEGTREALVAGHEGGLEEAFFAAVAPEARP